MSYARPRDEHVYEHVDQPERRPQKIPGWDESLYLQAAGEASQQAAYRRGLAEGRRPVEETVPEQRERLHALAEQAAIGTALRKTQQQLADLQAIAARQRDYIKSVDEPPAPAKPEVVAIRRPPPRVTTT